MHSSICLGVLLATVPFACGDAGGRATASDSAGPTAGSVGTGTSESGSDSDSDTVTAGSDGQSAGSSTTGVPTTSDGTGTATATTGDVTTTTTTTGVSATTSDTSTSGSTTGPNCDDMGGGGDALSVIWIANSGEGTVSKIDTKTGQELGRYRTRADAGGSPSRTSVNRHGDVAVANRTGGVTMVIARKERCIDKNNDGVIQTSTGGADLLAWGEDECVGWHTALAHGDNRPVAWTSGTLNPQTCEWENLDVWTGWSDVAPGTAVVALLDGDDGTIIQQVPIPDLPQPWSGWYGFYGAAVDQESNVWLSQLQGNNPQPAWLVRVNRDDFTYDHWEVPGEGGYGMTVTAEGYVWLCGRSTRRFDPLTATWADAPLLNGGVHTGGCMGDGEGILYRGSYAQIHGIDTQTMQVVKTLDVGQPGDDHIWGVAVDFDGKVWGVPRNGTRAYKIDPGTGATELVFQGLVSAYTYSDMTGFALFNVTPG
ncbi:hypothetical protein [Nannocystis pusilla]|uniref:Uncharacterized protein n=1 Tax=Nannocystis pusilla TaxID=889268 RepID=A0ABS7TV18_9BACT|nr:hypothetical protein [Nannocystis pusilla]MBZ5712095.1 hypothetical protein [Nannocystis pusilla]